ncbi:MAG: hypothetical protein M3069_00355 [Chloroflexota bacterium]|nr:hypothetical protein [Chloroflexota bacterium]
MPPVDTAARDAVETRLAASQSRLGLISTIWLALGIAFSARPAPVMAGLGALGMLCLLAWSGGFMTYYPASGWEFDASPQETVTMVALAVLFGLLLPLEVAAVARARSVAGGAGGVFGTIFGMLSMSCCAPLILPAVLSFVGFSGMTLLQVNVAVHEWATPLTIGSIGFMLVAIGLVSRTITAACALPPPTP